jgi:SAM-dependent methyltransferase
MSQPPDFNRLARFYRWMELVSFGPWLWWCRCAFLEELGACRYALILGDGDGRFTARLLEANPAVRIDAIDASPAMLKALIRRAGQNRSRVHAQMADARSWPPKSQPDHSLEGPSYDLVVTHFFLDCLTTEEVMSLAAKLHCAVSSSAYWMVSEFAVPEGWFGRLVAAPVVLGLYCAFGWLTGLEVRRLPDHDRALRQAGYTLEKRRAWLGGLLISQLWSARFSAQAPGQPKTTH